MAKMETTEFIAKCKSVLAQERSFSDSGPTMRLYGGPGQRMLDLGDDCDDYVTGPHEVARVLRALADYVETV